MDAVAADIRFKAPPCRTSWPSGWWILPAVAGGAAAWALLAVWLVRMLTG